MSQPMTSTPPLRPLMGGLSRIYPRHRLEGRVALRFEDLDRRGDARALNISARGMFIRSRDVPPAGSPVAFELSLNGSRQRIQGEGEVVWARRFELAADRPAGIGIRFLDLDEGSHRALESFIAERADPAEGGGEPAGGGRWQASTYQDPLSCLTSSEQHRLYAFAGCAVARPDRGWSRRLRRAFSSVRQALKRRG